MATETIYGKHGPTFLLWACRETGVLDALLDESGTAEDVAARAEITERAAEISLSALADQEYATCSEGTYAPTDRLHGLDPETPVTERGMLPHRLDCLDNYVGLPERMESGEYPEVTDRELENYVGGMATIGDETVRAGVTAAEHAQPRPSRVLDVGGGIGRFSREFARRGASVTLFDHPGVIELVRPVLADTGVDLEAGDALESVPQGFDLAFCGRLTVSFSPAENEQLFENLEAALDPGGTVVCMEYVRGESAIAPLFGLHMLTLSETGNTHQPEQYHDWLENAGFVRTRIESVPGTDFQAVVGEKPE